MTTGGVSASSTGRVFRFLSVLRHQQVTFLAVGITLLWATEPLLYLASLRTFSIGRTFAAVFFCAGHLFEVGFLQSYARSAEQAPPHVAEALLRRASWRYAALVFDVVGTALTLTGCAQFVEAGRVPLDTSNYSALIQARERTANAYFGGGLAFFTVGTVLWCQDYKYTTRELASVTGAPPPTEKGGIYATYTILQSGIALLTLGVFLVVAFPTGLGSLTAAIIIVVGALLFTYAAWNQVYVLWLVFCLAEAKDLESAAGEQKSLLPCC